MISFIPMALGVLGSPVVRYAAIGIAVFGFITWNRHDAAEEARLEAQQECRTEVDRRTAVELSRQRKAIETVLTETRSRAEAAEKANAELKGRADDLISQIRRAGSACPLSTDQLRQLRELQ